MRMLIVNVQPFLVDRDLRRRINKSTLLRDLNALLSGHTHAMPHAEALLTIREGFLESLTE